MTLEVDPHVTFACKHVFPGAKGAHFAGLPLFVHHSYICILFSLFHFSKFRAFHLVPISCSKLSYHPYYVFLSVVPATPHPCLRVHFTASGRRAECGGSGGLRGRPPRHGALPARHPGGAALLRGRGADFRPSRDRVPTVSPLQVDGGRSEACDACLDCLHLNNSCNAMEDWAAKEGRVANPYYFPRGGLVLRSFLRHFSS